MFNTNRVDLNRNTSLLRLCPNIFNGKTVLYIGASRLRFEFSDQLFKNCTTDVVEIFPDNVEYLRSLGWINQVYLADICDFTPTKIYQIVIWNHGPEHISEDRIPAVLEKLENYATEAVVLACPNGCYKQGPVYGNVYETHLSSLYNEFFNSLGYITECLGSRDTIGSNITAVKYNKSYYPWFTHRAYMYIHNYLMQRHNCNILEFGCGRSSVWFNQFTRNLISIDHDPTWVNKVRESCDSHAEIILAERPYAHLADNYPDNCFDVISVDGRDRVMCVKSAINKLKSGGIFVLDNSDRTQYNEAISLLNEKFGDGIEFAEQWKTTIWRNGV